MTTNDNTQIELDLVYEILKMHQGQIQKMTELLKEHNARILSDAEQFHQFRTDTEYKLDELQTRIEQLEQDAQGAHRHGF